MKPNDLLDAMGRISSEYVTEAKPAPKQQSDARTAKYDAEGTAEPVTVSRSGASAHQTTEKDYVMKKNTIIRRITTGFAAAAACAVFAGGGWFIYKQAQQQTEQEPDGQTVSEVSQSESSTPDVQPGDTNFFGGQGQLHVLRCRQVSYGAPQDVLYDDTRWYFRSGAVYAERTEEVAEFHDMPAEAADFYSHVLYDECGGFFYADGQSLYLMENDGSHPDTPFFTLTGEMLKAGLDSSTFGFTDAVKMTDTAYLISMEGEGGTFTAVCGTDGSVRSLADGSIYDHFLRGEDGSVYAVLAAASDGGDRMIVRIQADGLGETCTEFSGSPNLVEHMSVHGGKLYAMISCGDPDAVAPREYAEIDLASHDIGWMQPVIADTDPFVRCALTNGQQDFLIKHSYANNSDVLYSTDPAWENQQELFRFDASAELPDAVKARCGEAQREGYMIYNVWADARYLMMQISGQQYALYDLETGSMQYYFAERMPAGECVKSDELHLDESQYTELDPGFTGTNFLGGQGSLYIPKTADLDFMYDETYYYFPGMIFPRSGNRCVEYSGNPDFDLDFADHFIFSDGERLYVTKDGAVNLIDSSGKLTPFFSLSDVGADEYEKFTRVIRVGSSYLFCGAGNVWVDQNGRLLDGGLEKYEGTDVIPGSPDSDRSKYVYISSYFDHMEILRLADPASGEKPLKFALPDCREGGNNEYGFFSAVTDDKFLYLDRDGAFCGYDPDTGEKAVLAEAGLPDAEAMAHCCAVIDGRIYYMLADPYSEQPDHVDLMQLDMTTGERKKLLSYDIAELLSPEWIMKYGSKAVLEVNEGLAFYDPATGELFRVSL